MADTIRPVGDLVSEAEYQARQKDKSLLSGFGRGIARGTDYLQAGTSGFIASEANAAGLNNIRDLAEQNVQSNMEEAKAYRRDVGTAADIVSSFKNEGIGAGLKSTAMFGAESVGELVPQAATAALMYGLGKGAGGKLAGSILGPALAAGHNISQEEGSIYSDIQEKTGRRESEIARNYGVAAGLMDTASELIPMGKAFGGTKGTGQVVKDVVMSGLKQVPTEAGTEGLQTITERAAVAKVDPSQEVFSPEGINEIATASLAGGIGGGIAGAGGEAAGQIVDKIGGNRDVIPPHAGGQTGGTAEEDLQPIYKDPVQEAASKAEEIATQHVASKVQAAAAADPTAGPLSKAVNIGAQTGAVANEAARQVIEQPEILEKSPAVQPTVAQETQNPQKQIDGDFLSFGAGHFRNGGPRELPAELQAATPEQRREWYRGWDAENLANPVEVKPETNQAMQNRDRSSLSSVAQMEEIAKNPDYDRISQSKVASSGAPMAYMAGDQWDTLPTVGREETVTGSDGRKITAHYAVVEAGQLQASNDVSGNTNPAYNQDLQPGVLRALNNGRSAGIKAAYERGNADGYRSRIENDAESLGLDRGVIEKMSDPVLIRVYSEADNIGDMGIWSNKPEGLGLRPAEQAKTDARILGDLNDVVLDEDGNFNPKANMGLVHRFLNSMGKNESAALRKANGEPNLPLVAERLRNAMLVTAYGDDDLVNTATEAQDDAKNLISALSGAAARFATLPDAENIGIKRLVVRAAQMYRKAKEEGTTVEQLGKQVDITGGFSPEEEAVAEYIEQNIRSAKKVSMVLRWLAEYAQQAADSAGSMFGDDLPSTKAAAIDFANKRIAEEQGNEARQISRTPDEPARAGQAQSQDESPVAGAGPSGGEGFSLESYTQEEIAQREAAAKAAAEAEAEAAKKAEQKAKADAQVSSFSLTGSDRPADVAAAAGQNDMFGARRQEPAQNDLLTLNPQDNQDIIEQWRPIRDELAALVARYHALGGVHSPDSKAKVPVQRRAETVLDGITQAVETGKDLAEMPGLDDVTKFVASVKQAVEKAESAKESSDAMMPELDKKREEKHEKLKESGDLAKRKAAEEIIKQYEFNQEGIDYADSLGVDFRKAMENEFDKARIAYNNADVFDSSELHRANHDIRPSLGDISGEWALYFNSMASIAKQDGRANIGRAMGRVAAFEMEHLGSDRGQKALDEERARNPEGKFGKSASRSEKATKAIDQIKSILDEGEQEKPSAKGEEPNLVAAREIADRIRKAGGKKIVLGKIKKDVLDLARKIDPDEHVAAAMTLQPLADELGIGDDLVWKGQGQESKATAPEHVNLEENAGVSVDEMKKIAKEFRDHIDSGKDAGITRVFDSPKKDEIVRLNDKVKVYREGKGWMTPAEAKAEIQKWKDNAINQGKKGKNSGKVVLSLFDLSGEWSKPWAEAGYDVYRFDIQDDWTYEDEDGNEKKAGDINNLDYQFFVDMFGHFDDNEVYAILAASPCTDFAVSGARHFAAKDADGRTVASIKLVQKTLELIEHFKPAVWALENPVGRIEELTGLPPWRLSFDPNHLGDTYTKKTLIWGRFNADLPIAPVEPTEGSKMHKQFGGKSQATKNARSVTPEGFSYGFFQANNAIDNPLMAISNRWDMLDKDVIKQSLDAGLTESDIKHIVEDSYYMDQDYDAANKGLLDAIAQKSGEAPAAGANSDSFVPTHRWNDMGEEVLVARKDLDEDEHVWVDKHGTEYGDYIEEDESFAPIEAEIKTASQPKPKDNLPKAHLVDGKYYNDKKKKPWMTKARAETVLYARNLSDKWRIVPAERGQRGWIIAPKSVITQKLRVSTGEFTHKNSHIARIVRPLDEFGSITADMWDDVARQYGGIFKKGDSKTYEGSNIAGGAFIFDTKDDMDAFMEHGLPNAEVYSNRGAEAGENMMQKEPAKKRSKKASDAINKIKGILDGDGVSEDKPEYGASKGSGLSEEQRAQLGQAAIQLAEFYFESGLTKFADFARQMIADVGTDKIKPFIEAAYMGGRANLRQTDKALYGQTDKPETVEALVDSGLLDDLQGKDILGSEDDQQDADVEDSLQSFISDRLEEIRDNNDLKRVLAEFHGKQPTEAQIKEGQEAVELALVLKAREIVSDGEDMRGIFDDLLDVYESQPLLNSRTSTSMENQAYSTPLPLAFLASRLAGITSQTTVLEPTAGNGALLIEANPKNTTANEINEARNAALQSQGFNASSRDATKKRLRHAGYPVDAVIMNPPFGALDGGPQQIDGYSIGKIDQLIAAKSLENMKDNGRAVMIIAANKEEGAISRQDRIFFNWLYSHYNVVDHFEVDGKMYSRQGAGWPVSVITIDGRESSSRVSPKDGEIDRLDNWEQVYEHARKTLDSIGQRPADRDEGGTGRSDRSQAGLFDSAEISGNQVPEAGRGIRQDRGSRSGGSGNTESGSNSGGSTGDRSGRAGSSTGQQRSGSNVDQRNGQESANARPDDQGGSVSTVQKYDASRSNTGAGTSRAVKGSEFQAAYVSGSKLADDGALVPVNMQPAIEHAIDSLTKAVGDIDNYVMQKLKYTSQDEYEKAFMGLQADTIAAAIYNMEEKNKGIIIADQTGVGKGRQGAGIMRWAIKNGKIPVFISVKPNLFTDIYDDSMDIGLREISPFIMNKDGADIQKNGQMLFSMTPRQKTDAIRNMASTGKLPDGSNALFMTYSQITSSDSIQRNALSRLVAENGDKVVFILDEAHNVAGETEKRKKVKNGGSVVVRTGAGFINDIITGMPVTYLSATYAKRPDNMPVYHRTDLMDAVDSPKDLVTAAARGGEALQTVIANALARNGQLWRREKSYEGIEIKTIVESRSRVKHEKLANSVTNALKSIIDADNILSDWLENGGSQAVLEHAGVTSGAASHFGGEVEQHATHSPFTSIVHNYVRQMLLGLKADWIVEEAVALKKAGKKPVIALENTMESFLKEAIETGETKVGDTWDGDFSMILQKALSRTARITIEDNMGEKRRIPVPISLMPPVVRSAYNMAKRTIDAMNVDGIPIMPIDYIRHNLERNGITTGEITGRSLFLDYSSGMPVVSRRSEQDMNRRGSVDRFNAGDIDAIILNSAGSTGLSIHSRKDYADLRPRHMLVAQPMLDINIMMQMLGRINRTGQVVLPEYSLMGLDLPAEKRPLAIANRKMASLNANTSANTKSDTSLNAPDIMNKYGAQVISDFLMDNPDIAMAINVSSEIGEDAGADYAIKVTGRFALLPVDTQRYAYEEIEKAYTDLIAFLDATGQNDLKTETYDLNASIIETTEIYEGKYPGTQLGGNAYMHHVVVNKLGRPPTPAEVSARISDSLGGKTPDQILKEMIDSATKEQDKIDNETIEAAITSTVEKYEAATDDKERALLQDRLAKLHDDKEKAAAAAGSTADLLRRIPVGTPVTIDIGDDVVDGVVVSVTSKYKKGAGSPWASSKYDVVFAVNSTAQYVTMPLSSLRPITGKLTWSGEPAKDAPTAKINEIFKPDEFSTATERRYIATGNLVGAFSKIAGGRVINFTAANGKQYQGILMPRKFGDKEMGLVSGAPKTVRSASLLAKYLKALDRESVLSDLGIFSSGSTIRIAPAKRGGGYTVTIPSKADAIGDKIKFDKDLHEIMGGEFAGRGKYMTANIDESALERTIEHISASVPLSVPSIGTYVLDQESGGNKAPPPKSFDIEGAETDGVAYSGKLPPSAKQESSQNTETYAQDRPESVGFKTAKAFHAIKKIDLYVASLEKKLPLDKYRSIESVAKRHGGYYSSYDKNGAIPGFQFESEESRQKFLDDVAGAFSDGSVSESTATYGDRVSDRKRKYKAQSDLFDDQAPKEVAGAQARETFHIMYQSVPVGTVKVGTKNAATAEQAAHIFAPFRKHAQETVLALVVDKGGDVLSMIRHTKGTKDSSSVDATALVAAAASVPNAAGVWLGHNHPSGKTEPSQADIRVTGRIKDALDGSGVMLLGHIVVGHGNKATVHDKDGLTTDIGVSPFARSGTIEVMERSLKKRNLNNAPEIQTPQAARDLAKTIEADNALMLMDLRFKHVGTIAMTEAEMLAMRDNNQPLRILKAIDTTNASSILVKAKTANKKALKNLNKYFNRFASDVRILDVFQGEDLESLASKDGMSEISPGSWDFHRRGSEATGKGISREEARQVIVDFRTKYKGTQNIKVRVYDTKVAAYGEDQLKRKNMLNQKISGAYRNGEITVILEDNANAEELLTTLRHEAWTHYGFDLIPPLQKARVLKQLMSDIKGNAELNTIYERVRRSYRDDKGNLPDERIIAEETVAAIAEIYGDQIDARAMDDSLRGIVRRIIDSIANMLRSVGLIGPKDGMQAVMDHLVGRARYMRNQNTSMFDNSGVTLESRNGRDTWYYSALQEAAADMKQEKGTPDQMLAILSRTPGVKRAEIEATGLPEFLAMQGKSVTKGQILDYLAGNGVQVQETMLGDGSKTQNDITVDDLQLKLESQYGLTVDTGMDGEGEILDANGDVVDYYDISEEAQALVDQIAILHEDDGSPIESNRTKHERWQLPGGENYRELLLTLPSRLSEGWKIVERDGKFALLNKNGEQITARPTRDSIEEIANKYANDKNTGGKNFLSSHFDQPNILAHVRFNERTDSEGKRVLFLEEIQSDWAQKGRKEGFKADRLPDGWVVENTGEKTLDGVGVWQLKKSDGTYWEGGQKAYGKTKEKAEENFISQLVKSSVPSAPFVTSTDAWVGLAMKRMIAYAAENGFDRIAWTTGEQQADRYDLSKVVDRIVYVKEGDIYQLTGSKGKNDVVFFKNDVPESELEQHVGKEIAQKIIDGVGDKPKGKYPYADSAREISGVDLKTGGEGMRSFYDKIVPKVAREVTKKMGGKMLSVNFSSGDGYKVIHWEDGDELGVFSTREEAEKAAFVGVASQPHKIVPVKGAGKEQPGIDITPEMRAAVEQGLPLFSRAIREEGIPKNAALISSYYSASKMRSHADYRAAKSGDTDAAARLVLDLVKKSSIDEASSRFGSDVIFVAPLAKERSGNNAIPDALAAYYASAAGARVGSGFVQQNTAFHTGAKAIDRLLSRPIFDGEVEPGGKYVIVDDVITLGGTVAEMADHIRSKGGEVVGVVVLVNASRSAIITASDAQIGAVQGVVGDETVRELFSISPSALTAAEAAYLGKFKDAASVRGRAVKASAESKASEAQGSLPWPEGDDLGMRFSRKWQGSLFDDERTYSVDAKESPLYKARTAEEARAVTPADFARAVATNKQAEKIVSRGDKPEPGQMVGVRLHIGITNSTNVPVLTIHKGGMKIREKMPLPGNESGFYNGTAITYAPIAVVKDAYLTVSQKAREAIASGATTKEPMASVDGAWVETDSPSFDGVLVRFNPKKDHLFIDQKGRAVKWAEEATVMGHRAYLRGRIEYYSDADAPKKAGPSPSDAVIYDSTAPLPMDDLFFRRAAEGDGSAIDALKTHIQDRMQPSLNTFNWWNKSVGTQYHKAWKDRDYKAVFNQAQYYLNDTNRFAMEAADLAPGLLPKVDSFADILKSTGASRADIEAIADAIYTGTLTDQKVYSNKELAERFKLNERQRGLYREFRKAINHSLDAMTASEIAMEIKDDPELHQLVMLAKYRPEQALEQVIGTLEERAVELEDIARRMEEGGAPAKELKPYQIAATQARKTLQTVRDKLERLAQMKREGYAPLMRFGKYTVTVKNIEDGEIEYFGMFEKQSEARAMERSMAEEYGNTAEVITGVMSQEAYKLYSGMSPDTLELFGTSIGFDKSQSNIFQDYLRMSRNNRSALKRLIRRKGTSGFSRDVTRSLAGFITSNARQASGNWHLGEMDKTIERIRINSKEKGDVIDEAVRLRDYLRNPKDEAAAIRNLLFINYIGGSIASALTNMTQPITMTGPYLAQFGKATKHLLAAQKIGFGGKAEGDLGRAMERAIDEGLLAPHEVYQLHSEAIRNLGSNLYIRKLITAWGRPFALAEAYNRRLTFAAAYQMAKDNPAVAKQAGVASAYGFAVKAVQETQGIYNKGNRPNWARGALGATVFTFKQYSIGYLEFLQRLPRKQQLQAIGILFLLAGLQGLPFADDLEDLLDTIAQMMGYNLHTRSKLRELAIDTLGETAGDFIANGASSLPGSPIDVQARMGLGNLIPGTGILKASTTDKTRDIAEAVGPAGGLAMSIGQGIGSLLQGDIGSAALAAAPNAARNAFLGAQMAATGQYRDQSGRLIKKDVSTMDAIWKGIGFSPTSIAKESRAVSGERQRITLAREVEARIADRWAESVVEKDAEKRTEARKALADWNEKNPETPIRITPAQIRMRVKAMNMDRRQRLIKSAPKEMRGYLRQQ